MLRTLHYSRREDAASGGLLIRKARACTQNAAVPDKAHGNPVALPRCPSSGSAIINIISVVSALAAADGFDLYASSVPSRPFRCTAP